LIVLRKLVMIGVFKLCLFCEKQYFGVISILAEIEKGI